MIPEERAEIEEADLHSLQGDAQYNPDVWTLNKWREQLLAALTEAEADRDRARDAAVALEQQNAAGLALHAERVIREHDHETSHETGRTWSICTGCSSADIIDALDDGELIEEYEGVAWPCATYSALSGGDER